MKPLAQSGHLPDDASGNVVGQVSHNLGRLLLREKRSPGQFEYVGFDQLEFGSRRAAQIVPQPAYQPVINFNGCHIASFLEQLSGQPAGAGSNLENMVSGPNIGQLDDSVDQPVIDQKMLT